MDSREPNPNDYPMTAQGDDAYAIDSRRYEQQKRIDYLNSLQAEIEALKQQLAERDALIAKKDEALRCIDEDLVNPVNYILVKEALALKLKKGK